MEQNDGNNISDSYGPPLLQDQRFWKALIFLASIAFGYKLIAVSFYGFYKAVTANEAGLLIYAIHTYSWIAYIVMGLFWAVEKKVGLFLPVTGTACGVISVFSVSVLIIPIVYLIPLIALAIAFVKFHIEKDTRDNKPLQ